jgi:hypothetical protein
MRTPANVTVHEGYHKTGVVEGLPAAPTRGDERR